MICIHCKGLKESHVDLKCLFVPTRFEPARCGYCNEILRTWSQTPEGATNEGLSKQDYWFKDVRNSYWHEVCYWREVCAQIS